MQSEKNGSAVLNIHKEIDITAESTDFAENRRQFYSSFFLRFSNDFVINKSNSESYPLDLFSYKILKNNSISLLISFEPTRKFHLPRHCNGCFEIRKQFRWIPSSSCMVNRCIWIVFGSRRPSTLHVNDRDRVRYFFSRPPTVNRRTPKTSFIVFMSHKSTTFCFYRPCALRGHGSGRFLRGEHRFQLTFACI